MPSIPGSIMSSTTRSKELDERKLFSAASPSPTTFTLIPSRSKARSIMSLTPTSSSTNSILGIYGVYLRQLKLNCCANPFSRTDRDAAPHPLDKFSTDGQPQTEAFGVALSAVEALEDMGKVVRAYPGSLIFHDNSAWAYAKPYIFTPV